MLYFPHWLAGAQRIHNVGGNIATNARVIKYPLQTMRESDTWIDAYDQMEPVSYDNRW